MYVCMYVCMYCVLTQTNIHVCIEGVCVCMNFGMLGGSSSEELCMYVCMYVCMYILFTHKNEHICVYTVCMSVFLYSHTNERTHVYSRYMVYDKRIFFLNLCMYPCMRLYS
jgi:hypothetical protein